MQSKLQSNLSNSNADDKMEEAHAWDVIITDKLHPRETAAQPHYREDLSDQLQDGGVCALKSEQNKHHASVSIIKCSGAGKDINKK